MIRPLRRFISLHAARVATSLAMGGAATLATAGEVIHHLEHVSAPGQDVCRGNGCAVNTQTYAWHATQWRRWPGTTTLPPSPGRGDRIEPVASRPAFDMPTPATAPTQSQQLRGTGVRTPIAAPARGNASTAPPRTTPSQNGIPLPDSATSVTTPAAEPSGPPIDLDELFKDEDAPPAAEPPTDPDEIPPPFDSKRSGGKKTRDPVRTLNALSAGLKAKKAPPIRSNAPSDPWQAASVRAVNGERAVSDGPSLNEPNLMSEPGDGPQLQKTPGEDLGDLPPQTQSTTDESGVLPAANWTEMSPPPPGATMAGGNPLRAGASNSGSRRSNPLRR